MDYSQIAKTIIALKNNDLEFRKKLIKRGQLGKGYNKEMAQKWTVVVRKKEDKVNLYCDTCWDKANQMIEEIKEDIK